MNTKKILELSLLSGAAYFLCISIAHFLEYKVPGLFIYYDIPSYQYQDGIISFLAFGWAVFFYAASNNPEIVKHLLLAAIGAIGGLINITLSTELDKLGTSPTGNQYWIQIAFLTAYVGWLIFFAVKVRRL